MRAFLQRLTAPPAQILQTLQPSPYTVSYTVSTRRVPKTIFTRVASHVGLLLRTVVGLLAALLLWLKSQLQVTRTGHILLGVLNRPRTHQLFEFVDGCQWTYLAPCVLLVFMLVFRRNYAEESLTVLRGLGIQTSTSSRTYLQAPTTRFIATTSIQDIFIYEAFKGFEVRFYLAIVVEGEEDVVVVFPTLLPRRAILEEVWRGTKRCLWEHKHERQLRKDTVLERAEKRRVGCEI